MVFLSFELKYLTPNVGLYMKLKLLKSYTWCGNFKTSAKKEIFKKYKNNCQPAKKRQISKYFLAIQHYLKFNDINK